MRSPFRIFNRTQPAPAAPAPAFRAQAPSDAAASSRGAPSAFWPYSSSYTGIVDEGHQRPPPAFGTPTLVWHLGIWPTLTGGELDPRTHDINLTLKERIEIHDAHNRDFFKEIGNLLTDLQERGRVLGTNLRKLDFSPPHLAARHSSQTGAVKNLHAFGVVDPQSVTFTLWWQDGAGKNALNARQHNPAPSDLRVRVQAQTHLDHATISFFIDAQKPWDAQRVRDARIAVGQRRRAIFQHVENVNAICHAQIKRGFVDRDRLPENVTADEAKQLLAAADYCYDDIWEEFVAAFGFEALVSHGQPAQSRIGEVFANYRSLVIASDGIQTPAADKRTNDATALRRKAGVAATEAAASGGVGFGRFDTFDDESGEPNTVLKAYWPFARRMAPAADDRDFIACGMFDWRALYVTALGSRAEQFERDEADSLAGAVPGASLPPVDTTQRGQYAPIRQLFLTKGEPHRQQIGRIVERTNAVSTMRLFALRNWGTIRNAGIHIRLIGEQLDGILAHWSERRKEINDTYGIANARDRSPDRLDIDPIPSQQTKDARVAELTVLISDTEARLIRLGADLDGIGQGGSGRLLYVINRAKHFIEEFRRLIDTLHVANVPTWITYDQFIERGLSPTFDAIRTTGERLNSLRGRLQSITEMVQTGALIVETEATQSNTQTLRRIATNWDAFQNSLVGVMLAVVAQSLFSIGGQVVTILATPGNPPTDPWIIIGVQAAFLAGLVAYLWLHTRQRD